MALTYKQADQRLLKLADAVEKAADYDQRRFQICGIPACAGGHAVTVFPDHWTWYKMTPILKKYKQTLNYDGQWRAGIVVFQSGMEFFMLNAEERGELFKVDGCGDAGQDNHKAAAYIRDFVARRQRARRHASEVEEVNCHGKV